MTQTVADIQKRLRSADEEEFAVLERSLIADTRKGVQQALKSARHRLDEEKAERDRVCGLFSFERSLTDGACAAGLDEVGRGPLAGPLTVAAVVFDDSVTYLEGLNDSKQVPEAKRAFIAQEIKKVARAWAVYSIEPASIDDHGMAACLRKAFSEVVKQIEAQGIIPERILLDGNPLHFDSRETNIVKGDAKCASIAAASLIAKTTRDAMMVEYDKEYPGYDFASSKGYGSAAHRKAIEEKGLTPIHRKSFCTNFMQERLF